MQALLTLIIMYETNIKSSFFTFLEKIKYYKIHSAKLLFFLSIENAN